MPCRWRCQIFLSEPGVGIVGSSDEFEIATEDDGTLASVTAALAASPAMHHEPGWRQGGEYIRWAHVERVDDE